MTLTVSGSPGTLELMAKSCGRAQLQPALLNLALRPASTADHIGVNASHQSIANLSTDSPQSCQIADSASNSVCPDNTCKASGYDASNTGDEHRVPKSGAKGSSQLGLQDSSQADSTASTEAELSSPVASLVSKIDSEAAQAGLPKQAAIVSPGATSAPAGLPKQAAGVGSPATSAHQAQVARAAEHTQAFEQAQAPELAQTAEHTEASLQPQAPERTQLLYNTVLMTKLATLFSAVTVQSSQGRETRQVVWATLTRLSSLLYQEQGVSDEASDGGIPVSEPDDTQQLSESQAAAVSSSSASDSTQSSPDSSPGHASYTSEGEVPMGSSAYATPSPAPSRPVSLPPGPGGPPAPRGPVPLPQTPIGPVPSPSAPSQSTPPPPAPGGLVQGKPDEQLSAAELQRNTIVIQTNPRLTNVICHYCW